MTSQGRSGRTSSSSEGRSTSTGAVVGAEMLTRTMMPEAAWPRAGLPGRSGLRHVPRPNDALFLGLQGLGQRGDGGHMSLIPIAVLVPGVRDPLEGANGGEERRHE